MRADFVKHIEKLLYSSECVVIPGFGAFVANRRPASVQSDIIYPASKVWAFNPALKHHDGQLASAVAMAEGIPYSEALDKVNSQVSGMLRALAEDRTVQLGEVGSFTKGPEGVPVFRPSAGPGWVIGNYGLYPVRLTFTAGKQENKTGVPDVTELNPDAEGGVKVLSREEREPELVVNRKKRRAPVWAALSVLTLLAAAGVVITRSTFFNHVNQSSLNPLGFDTRIIDKLVEKAERENPALSRDIDDSIQENVPATEPVEESQLATAPAAPDSLYYTIGGAFAYQANAEKFSRQLDKKGFDPELIRQPGYRLVRVSYGTYRSRNEADSALETIRQSENPEAWLLVIANPNRKTQ